MRFYGAKLLLVAVALGSSGCAGAMGDGSALSSKSPADAVASSIEQRLIAGGEIVTRPLDFDRGASHYVGGVSSGLVPATKERVLAAMNDPEALSAMLPSTKRVSLVDAHPESRRVELLQGNSWVNATYTVELSKVPSEDEILFRMDRSRHHDIDDVYGYFKVERFDDRRSVVTVAAAVDIGSGMTSALFGRKVQQIILSTPGVIRNYFAQAEPSDRTPLVAENDR
jgi:carbon monoxide dehydrogenase subunit G